MEWRQIIYTGQKLPEVAAIRPVFIHLALCLGHGRNSINICWMDEWIGWLVSHPLFTERFILFNSPRMRIGSGAPFMLGAQQSWTGNGPFSLVS